MCDPAWFLNWSGFLDPPCDHLRCISRNRDTILQHSRTCMMKYIINATACTVFNTSEKHTSSLRRRPLDMMDVTWLGSSSVPLKWPFRYNEFNKNVCSISSYSVIISSWIFISYEDTSWMRWQRSHCFHLLIKPQRCSFSLNHKISPLCVRHSSRSFTVIVFILLSVVSWSIRITESRRFRFFSYFTQLNSIYAMRQLISMTVINLTC